MICLPFQWQSVLFVDLKTDSETEWDKAKCEVKGIRYVPSTTTVTVLRPGALFTAITWRTWKTWHVQWEFNHGGFYSFAGDILWLDCLKTEKLSWSYHSMIITHPHFFQACAFQVKCKNVPFSYAVCHFGHVCCQVTHDVICISSNSVLQMLHMKAVCLYL